MGQRPRLLATPLTPVESSGNYFEWQLPDPATDTGLARRVCSKTASPYAPTSAAEASAVLALATMSRNAAAHTTFYSGLVTPPAETPMVRLEMGVPSSTRVSPADLKAIMASSHALSKQIQHSQCKRSNNDRNGAGPRRCLSCRTTRSPAWRPAWAGAPACSYLCNSCGLRWRKTHMRCTRNECQYVPLRMLTHDVAVVPSVAGAETCPACGGRIAVYER